MEHVTYCYREAVPAPARPLEGRRVVVVDGARTPFLRSQTEFQDLMAYELGAMAVAGLVQKSGLDPALVDRVILGTVLQEPKTSNLAREVALAARLPDSCPAFTVTAACASANTAITSAAEAIACGAAGVVIAGGAELLSDVPIRFSRRVRKRLIAAQKAKGLGDTLKLAAGLKLRDLKPEAPAIAEFSTGKTMGDSGERLAKRFGLTREEQDAWALASHHRAEWATKEGHYRSQVVPAYVSPGFQPIAKDNGIRSDTTLEKLANLPPAFDRKFGSVTAGNSSFLTDGAAACLLMSEEKANELSLKPLAAIKSYALVALDPVEELLLGPVVSVPPALDAAGIALSDVGVFEIHEAFASPVLAFVRLLANADYCKSRLGRAGAVGEVDTDRMNAWGGSLSLGHPFGATGARLVMTACRRLVAEDARWAVVSACAAGAIGHAIVLERV